MAKGVDKIAHHTFTKERQPQAMTEISCHQPDQPSEEDHAPSYPQLKAKAEELLTEKQAGFKPGLSTVEQIFNSQVILEKHLQHQRSLFHNFIDVKKVLDRVWHAGLWQVLRSINMDEGLVPSI